MRPKLFEFGLEQLLFVICNRLFVQNQDAGDVVVVCLCCLQDLAHYDNNFC